MTDRKVSYIGIEKYLSIGLIKDMGSKFAKRIVNLFGMDTISVIADTSEQLNEVDNIGKKRTELLDTEREAVSDTLEKILNTSNLSLDKEAIYLLPFYMTETGVARELKLLNDSPAWIDTNLKVNIQRLQKKIDIEYDEI